MVFLLAIAIFSIAGYAGPLAEMQRKHRAAVEAWTFTARVATGPTDTTYFGLFFVSGKKLFVSGGYLHFRRLAMPSSSYTTGSDIVSFPFGSIEHDFHRLHERMGGSTIQSDTPGGAVRVTAGFKELRGRFVFFPERPHVSLEDVFPRGYAQRKFDWYLFPRCSVSVRLPGRNSSDRPGRGYMQQFWGEEGGANCDWIVAHAGSGHDLIITDFPPDRREPWLPGNYLVIGRPDGSRSRDTLFEYTPRKKWTSPRTGKQYSVAVRVSVPAAETVLLVRAFREDQAARMGGTEYWYGFGSVEGTIEGEHTTGWAYMSLLGRPEE